MNPPSNRAFSRRVPGGRVPVSVAHDRRPLRNRRDRLRRGPGRTLFTAVLLMALAARPARAARPITTSLVEYMRSIRAFMPTQGSNAYVVPSAADRLAFRAAARALAADDVATAERALAAYPDFEILALTDAASGASYHALVEKAPLPRGWGFFLFARGPARPDLVLEIPHPLADRDSELAGAKAAVALRPAVVLFAGAHRYATANGSSDVAHVAASIFESVHEVALTQGRVALQIHGFSTAGHPDYPEILISSGTTSPGPDGQQVCRSVTAANQGVGCVLFDGSAYTDLGAQANVQGSFARRTFGPDHFLHIETADSVRVDGPQLAVLINALAARWPEPETPAGCAMARAENAVNFWAPLAVLLALSRRRHRTDRGVVS